MTEINRYSSGFCPVTGCSGPVSGVSARMRRAAGAFARAQAEREAIIPPSIVSKASQTQNPMMGHNRRLPKLIAAE
jgi:hypothetical protein